VAADTLCAVARRVLRSRQTHHRMHDYANLLMRRCVTSIHGFELSLGDDHTFCDTYLVHGAANTWQHHLAGNHPVGEVFIDAS